MKEKFKKAIIVLVMVVIMVLFWTVYERPFQINYVMDPTKGFDQYGSMIGVAAWYTSIGMIFELLRVISLVIVVFATMAVLLRAFDERRLLFLSNFVMAFDVICLVVITLAEKSDFILAPLLKMFLKINDYPVEEVKSIQRVRENLIFFENRVPVLILLGLLVLLLFVLNNTFKAIKTKVPEETYSISLFPLCCTVTIMTGVRWIFFILFMGNINLRQITQEAKSYFADANAAISDYRPLIILPISILLGIGIAILLKEKKHDMKEGRVTLIAVLISAALTVVAGIFLTLCVQRYSVDGQLFYKVAAKTIIVSLALGLGVFDVICTCYLLRLLYKKCSVITSGVYLFFIFAGNILLFYYCENKRYIGYMMCFVTISIFAIDAIIAYVRNRKGFK